MTAIHGENEYRYTISNSWAKVPPGMEWSEVAAVAIDHRDQVYVFNGWTFASSPSLRPLDHAIYDLWLVRCSNI